MWHIFRLSTTGYIGLNIFLYVYLQMLCDPQKYKKKDNYEAKTKQNKNDPIW